MKLILNLFLILNFGCANYVGQFHRQIDQEEASSGKKNAPKDGIALVRQKYQKGDRRPIENPITYSLGGVSSQMTPSTNREYKSNRRTSKDFVDQSSSGSLWANQGSSASLFTYQNDKQIGDIIIINVLENLRNQISSELKRAFPEKKKTKEEGQDPNKPATPPPAATAAGTPPADPEMDMKVFDKISGTVTEEIGKDYYLLRGKKQIIYQAEKRSIEVQALVSKKDIMENDYVNSDKILESRINILR